MNRSGGTKEKEEKSASRQEGARWSARESRDVGASRGEAVPGSPAELHSPPWPPSRPQPSSSTEDAKEAAEANEARAGHSLAASQNDSSICCSALSAPLLGQSAKLRQRELLRPPARPPLRLFWFLYSCSRKRTSTSLRHSALLRRAHEKLRQREILRPRHSSPLLVSFPRPLFSETQLSLLNRSPEWRCGNYTWRECVCACGKAVSLSPLLPSLLFLRPPPPPPLSSLLPALPPAPRHSPPPPLSPVHPYAALDIAADQTSGAPPPRPHSRPCLRSLPPPLLSA